MAVAEFSPAPLLPRPPRRLPPPRSCDTHAHIFGPAGKYPLSTAGYAPPLAPYEAYREMLAAAGVERGILVQPSVYMGDHRVLVDALQRSGGKIRGIGLATSAIAQDELEYLSSNGVIGLRFVEVANPQTGRPYEGSVGLDELIKLAPRMRALGMQAHLWADCERLISAAPTLQKLGVPLVIDHLGRPKTADGVQAADFKRLSALVADGVFWVKLVLCRASGHFPDYPDARPFHDELIAANPDRLVWGSDWPHIRLGDKAPDVGRLLDLFDEWISGDKTLREKILVTNPSRLFFGEIHE